MNTRAIPADDAFAPRLHGAADSLARRFAAIAARQPDALAIVTGSRRLGYGALAAQVDALAAAICAARAGDAGAIAVVAGAGVPLAIATLAALQLGRACIPLDPRMPAARRDFIIADAGATLRVDAGDDANACAFDVAPIGDAMAQAPTHPRISAPDTPALILYTSGSTGTPKGVVYAERAIIERIVERDRFGIGTGDRIGVFGAAGMNLFRALLRGAALASWDVARDGIDGIDDWIEREEITLLHCLPTLFRQWTDAMPTPRAWPRLRCVSLTGEPVFTRDVAAYRRLFPAHCVMANGLGTTEAGTFCQFTIDHRTVIEGEIVPVGHAVEGMAITLVDAAGAPVAEGQQGEIAVEGKLLAAGYWRRPELEIARFVDGGARPGVRRYLTGDVGRRMPDGTLLHLGRRDQQVKIRGVRVEAAEVEAALFAHPDVRAAAVTGQCTVAGEARLVACIAARAWRDDLASALARHVRTRLPDAMVPDAWTFVDALPLTPAGKVDRRALPAAPPRRPRRFGEGIVARFARIAAQHRDAIAYLPGVPGERAITFAELDRRAHALAMHLVANGVREGDVVVIALARDAGYAVAMLAVLRAGAACMPLDPAGPRERNAAMLRAANAAAMIVANAAGIGVMDGVARIDPAACVDADAQSEMPEFASPPFDPARLAFVIYTSGSSGVPKAVEVSEGQVLHRLDWDWRARPWRGGEVACQRGTPGFVDTIAEWLGPLLCGVPTAVIADALLLQPRAMIAALAAARVSRILLVPSQLELLLDAGVDLAQALPSLRLWTASGEALAGVSVARFRHALPHGELWNVYGATEAWDATCHRVSVGDAGAIVPIGAPLPGMRAYVLDDALAPVPTGSAGELHVAGDGLALGYRGDAGLTRERFIDNPFSPGSGDRLYRTGDRARMRDDGLIECLGRSDRRVKVSGVRIELGEIETALALHASVREVAVVHAGGHIVAHVAGHAGPPLDIAALRVFARERLPGAAVPREFIVHAALPRNVRGKLERSALAAPARTIVAAQNELERVLAQGFADLLGHGPIGATDDFFDQGGDSLLAVRLVAEIEVLTGRPFRLDTLAAAPTPRAIAAHVGSRWSDWTSSRMTINAGGGGVPLFGICGAWGYALRLLRLGRALDGETPFHALQPPLMQWPEGIGLRDMAAHYADEIVRAHPLGPCQLIGTSFGGTIAFEVALQLQRRDRDVALLCAVDSAAPGSQLKLPPPLANAGNAIEQAGLRIYLAHLAAAQGYRPDATYSGRVVYYRCSGSKRAVVRDWSRLLREPMEIVPVPGGHGEFHREPQLGAIAAHLRGALAGTRDPRLRVTPITTLQWSFGHGAALGSGGGPPIPSPPRAPAATVAPETLPPPTAQRVIPGNTDA
ncbi:MAG: amino acid adenylation domain-containing protein [Betaproteobacteria bacterium]